MRRSLDQAEGDDVLAAARVLDGPQDVEDGRFGSVGALGRAHRAGRAFKAKEDRTQPKYYEQPGARSRRVPPGPRSSSPPASPSSPRWDADGRPTGLTASAFTSVSLDPPLILVCVTQNAQSYGALAGAGRFAVNILAQGQEALSRRFATTAPGAEKFEGVAYRAGALGVPLLDGALAQLECPTAHAYPGGDHTIFVGQVEAGHSAPRGGARAAALLPREVPPPGRRREVGLMPIPLSRPPVDDEIKAAVLAAIDSRQYILGPECRAFEAEFAAYNGRAPRGAHVAARPPRCGSASGPSGSSRTTRCWCPPTPRSRPWRRSASPAPRRCSWTWTTRTPWTWTTRPPRCPHGRWASSPCTSTATPRISPASRRLCGERACGSSRTARRPTALRGAGAASATSAAPAPSPSTRRRTSP